MTPVFSSGKIKMMFDIVDSIDDKLSTEIASDVSSNLEISEWLCRYTTDAIVNIAFGLDPNCLADPGSEFRKYGKKIFKITSSWGALKLLFIHSFPNFSRKMGFMLNPKDSSDFFKRVFSENIKHREEKNIERNDFVQLLIQMKRKGLLNMTELTAESFIFFFGGFHTSASLMTFIFLRAGVES